MKLQLDSTRCQGYGLCQEQAADVLELDEWGYAAVVGDVTDERRGAGRRARPARSKRSGCCGDGAAARPARAVRPERRSRWSAPAPTRASGATRWSGRPCAPTGARCTW